MRGMCEVCWPRPGQGDVATEAVDGNVVLHCQGTWADLHKATLRGYKSTVSVKSRRQAF